MTTRKKGDLFARISLDYADHPKIAPLSDAAFRAHVEFILYARKYRTDGRIPNRIANRVGYGVLHELMSNDPERPSLTIDENNDYWIRDYGDHQETSAEIEAKRLVNARNGRKGGRPVTQSVSDPVTESLTEIKAETETETETEIPKGLRPLGGYRGEGDASTVEIVDVVVCSSADAESESDPETEAELFPAEDPGPSRTDHADDFAAWWELYPRKVGKGQAARAYRTARKKATAEALTAAIVTQGPLLMARGSQYCPHPATWLNGERWRDDPVALKTADPNRWTASDFARLIARAERNTP